MPASTNSTSAPESSAASTGSGANSQQSQQLPSANDSSQASQQHQPSSALSATSSSSSLASRILAPFLRFTSSSSVAVPSGLPSPLAAAGTSSSEKGTSATSSVTGSEQAQQDALHNEQGDNGEKMQQQTSLFGSSSLTSGETVIAQPAVAFDNDQPVVQQTAPLGVTEYLLLETLARTISAKATWSQAVSAAQATAASLNLTDPVPAKLVILEQDCEDPWTQRDAIRQVEVVIRPDIFMSVASAAKMVDHAATVFMRMLNKYRLAKVMAEAMDMTSIDPMPWQLMSLHVLREHLLGHFTHQPARIPLNGFGHAIAAAAAPTGAADSVAGSITADIDGGGAESDAVNSSVHKRCASSASDASSTGSCASPNVRRLGSGLVGSSMPTPALLTSRESHLDRRPTSLVNYNNSSTARNKYVSPPSSTVALNHPEAHLLVRNSTPVPYVHARPQSPVSEHQARVAHPKPHKLTLSIPNARHAPRPAPAEFSPLIFDKNRYIRPGGAPIALHSDSPLATPLPSPGPTSPGNMGIALPAAAANAGLMLSEGVMRAMAANGGRLSRPSTPAARAMSGLDGSSGSGGTTQEGSSSLSKSQAV